MAEEHPSNADIMRELGAITATLEGMQRELDVGRESRGRIHAKLEEHGSRLDKIDAAIEMQALISGQTREVLKELADIQRTLASNAQPLLDLRADLPVVVENWKDLKKTGKRIGWALTLVGGSFIAFVVWFGDVARQAILHWLGIPPG